MKAFLSLLLVSLCFSMYGGELHLKSEAVLSGDSYCLNDLVQKSSLSQEEQKLYDSFSKITMGKLPLSDHPMKVTDKMLVAFMTRYDQKQLIKISNPHTIMVERKMYRISADQLEEKIFSYLRSKEQIDRNIEFSLYSSLSPVAFPNKPAEMNCSVRSNTSARRKVVRVQWSDRKGKTLKSINVVVQLKKMKPVWVAYRDIERGDFITEEDMYQVQMDVLSLRRNVFSKYSQIEGKTAKARIKHGAYFTANNTWMPPIVKRGQKVLIVAKRGLVEVSASGKALVNGHVGDEIMVENLNSHRRIQGVVKDSGTVVVPF